MFLELSSVIGIEVELICQNTTIIMLAPSWLFAGFILAFVVSELIQKGGLSTTQEKPLTVFCP